MNDKKGVFVSEIIDNSRIQGIFCVSSKRLLETKNGDPYLALTLMDCTGDIQARIWDRAEDFAQLFETGDYVLVEAEVQRYREALQLKVVALEPVDPDSVDHSHYMPVTHADIDRLWSDFRRLIRSVRDPVLSALLTEIFSDRPLVRAFKQAPAAKKMHHAYLGGLLEHSLSVANAVLRILDHYKELDQDLLLSAALVHDIGKIEEFSYDRPPIDYTDKGRLVGHLVIGVEIIDRFVQRLRIDKEDRRLVTLKHLVLSHHGHREFGAPVLPMTKEAIVLYMVDDMDAKLNYLDRLSNEIPPGDFSWTEYQRPMDRYFFLKGRASDEGQWSSGQAGDQDLVIQPLLWPEDDKKETSG